MALEVELIDFQGQTLVTDSSSTIHVKPLPDQGPEYKALGSIFVVVNSGTA